MEEADKHPLLSKFPFNMKILCLDKLLAFSNLGARSPLAWPSKACCLDEVHKLLFLLSQSIVAEKFALSIQ